ncbi:MAG: sugar-binding domain-containing protein [Pontiella sp.]
MKNIYWIVILLSLLQGSFSLNVVNAAELEPRQKLNFNMGWKFIKANVAGAAEVGFDDAAWATVSCPHTYNDIDTFDDWSPKGHVGELNQWNGKTWYRKHFTINKEEEGKRIYIEFESVRQIAEVYLNGTYLGKCENGFVPFGFDLTPHLKFGEENILALMCDNTFYPVGSDCRIHHKEGLPWNDPHWHPAHGGIYRNVYLHVVNPVHVTLPLYNSMKTVGTYVYTQHISKKAADIGFDVEVANDSAVGANVRVVNEVLDAAGKVVLSVEGTRKISPHSKIEISTEGELASPKLWSPSFPYLYTVETKVYIADQLTDCYRTPLGIRSFRMDDNEGFFINGKHIKLVGWGQKSTSEWPGLGAAHPDWMHDYTLKLMKEAGANFIRWGHTAGGPADIRSSDRYGLVTLQPGVDSEGDIHGHQWDVRAQTFRDMIVYYRNNPSIFLWEGGNQSVSKEHLEELVSHVQKFDPKSGRLYGHRRANAVTGSYSDFSVSTEGSGFREDLPTVEGEYNREESPRRVWDDFSPPDFDYVGGEGQTYDLTSEQFAVNQIFQFKKIIPTFHGGGANWIFSDSTSGGRVACEVARASGEVDAVRLPKEAYHVCKVLFSETPQIHLIGHWTYPEGTIKDLFVASNCEEVELLVNGRSLGRKIASDRWNQDEREAPYLFTFPHVQWRAGAVEVRGYIGGRKVASQVKKTSGKPDSVRLSVITGPDGLWATGADVALVDAEVVDRNGIRCPTFQGRIDFKTTGSAIWRGGYNSGKTNSINKTFLDLECGINRVAIRSTPVAGKIEVSASVAGLKPATLILNSKPVPLEYGISSQLPMVPDQSLLVSSGKEQITVQKKVGQAVAMTGRKNGNFLGNLSYSGPSGKCLIGSSLGSGKTVYTDRAWTFKKLPQYLLKSDYISISHEDRRYSAVDLIQVDVINDCDVYVAHDDRLKRPTWLTDQYAETADKITVANTVFSLYRRWVEKGSALTFGSNADDDPGGASKMYMVFAAPARSSKNIHGKTGSHVAR